MVILYIKLSEGRYMFITQMIMRDVNNGWLIRYTHANVASFFFMFVYAHIGRGLYYGSYKSPRILVWSIGVVILVLMMADYYFWPNCEYDFTNTTYIGSSLLPINKSRTKAIFRIGPHNKQILDIIICGMLGDFSFRADKIPGKTLDSTRIQIEQSIKNSAYIHYLTLYFYNLGYCAKPVPVLVEKKPKILPLLEFPSSQSLQLQRASFNGSENGVKAIGRQEAVEKRFNYRLTLFTFTSLTWIYDSFYTICEGPLKPKKKVPYFIDNYLTPIGLAH